MAFVAARVAPYKRVRRLEIIDQIPKSPTARSCAGCWSSASAWRCRSSSDAGPQGAALSDLIETSAQASWAEVQQRFREQLSPLRLFPGAALAVYLDGRLVLDLAGGFADTQRGEAVGPEALFPLFSGTKPFGAVALWQQIERGRLDLDDPVAAHWPAFGPMARRGCWCATSFPTAEASRPPRRH